jgi:hypothetical protein
MLIIGRKGDRPDLVKGMDIGIGRGFPLEALANTTYDLEMV